MRTHRSLPVNLAVALGLATVAFPAMAMGILLPPGGGGGGGSVSTPAPLAGTGLLAVGVAGVALYAVVRWFRRPR